MFLLDKDDITIDYNIFEEFDIGAVSFLHHNSLDKLFEPDKIIQEVRDKSLKLRERFFELQSSLKYCWRVEMEKIFH